MAPASDKFCNIFLECIELTELLNQEIYKNNENRMKNRQSLNDIINKKMKLETSDYWIKKLNDAGCPAAKVASLPEALDSQLIKDYVKSNYDWEIIVEKFLKKCCKLKREDEKI